MVSTGKVCRFLPGFGEARGRWGAVAPKDRLGG
jgi:hypothetical protein